MKLWNTIKKLNSGDRTSRFTKFSTIYIMPLAIMSCAFGFWYTSKILDLTLTDFASSNSLIEEYILEQGSNSKQIETNFGKLSS